jgi:hypothetical protein
MFHVAKFDTEKVSLFTFETDFVTLYLNPNSEQYCTV